MISVKKTTFEKKRKSEQGFTLVELAIVILIGTILLIPLISAYTSYVAQKKLDHSKKVIEAAKSALISYYVSTGSYPCPYDLTKGMNSDGFGEEYCGTKSFTDITTDTTFTPCKTGGGICRVAGSWDADGDGNADPILIGGVPFATLAKQANMTMGVEDIAEDDWGGMLYYAVSLNLTKSSNLSLDRFTNGLTNDYQYGVITALDEFNNPTAGIGGVDLDNLDGDGDPLTGRDGDSQFVVFSAGPDGVGAFSLWGRQKAACDTTTQEGENCDADGTFKSSLTIAEANTTNRFDDIVYFNKIPSGDIWGYIINAATGGVTGSIRNLNQGNIGVMTANDPQTLLDVNGTIKVPSLLTDFVCKTDSSGAADSCLPTRFLLDDLTTLTSISTPSGLASFKNRCSNTTDSLSGIKNGQVQCTTVSPPAAPPAHIICDSGAYVKGVRTDGCILCTSGTSPKCPPIIP